jgi:methionyl-tRNA formyltransferase
VVAAYGLIIPQSVLDWPRLGCVNIHASLLPRWRGAAPIQRAILAGDACTGITLMQMDAGLDTGAMLCKSSTPISPTDTAASLHDRLAEMGANLLCEALPSLDAGRIVAEPQDNSQANYAHKLSKSEGELHWDLPAETLTRQIRGLTPWPGCYTFWQGQRVKIHAAKTIGERVPSTHSPGTVTITDDHRIIVNTGDGALQIDRLQLPGSRAMSATEFLNGNQQWRSQAIIFTPDQPPS